MYAYIIFGRSPGFVRGIWIKPQTIIVVLGWIFTNDKKQRIFNRASNTVVIRV
jgi:hypothetical protein